MADDVLELQKAETALRDAENSPNANALVVAERLEELASILRKQKIKLLDAANLEAKAKVMRSKLSPEQLLHCKFMKIKDMIAKRLELGQLVSVYRSIELSVDSVLMDRHVCQDFSIEPLFSLGLRGWEVVATVPKTVGIGLTNNSYGNNMGTTWGGGVGGNVVGVHVLLKKSLGLRELDDDDVIEAILEQVEIESG